METNKDELIVKQEELIAKQEEYIRDSKKLNDRMFKLNQKILREFNYYICISGVLMALCFIGGIFVGKILAS